jgi:hypothetical protein
MEYERELKTEIKKCCICKKWIDWTNQLVIINHKHYHKICYLYTFSTTKSGLKNKTVGKGEVIGEPRFS